MLSPRAAAPAATLVVGLALVFGACTPAPPTYKNAVAQIVDAKCNGCHHDGGIAPFPLTSYADLVQFKAQILPAIDSRQMPPWLPGGGCAEYRNDFSLTDDELKTLDQWFADGMEEGDGPDPQAAGAVRDPAQKPIRYDLLFPAAEEPYTPRADDEYRCYAIPWTETAEKYVTGFDMIPGDPTNVHHVNVFLNPPPDAPGGYDFVADDEADPLPGWDCGGGDRVLVSSLIGAWAPGASGTAYPEGSGQLVEPGSIITLEVHYAHRAGALPDASQLAVQVEDSVQNRGIGVAFYSFNDWDHGGMLIPAHDPAATHDLEVDPALELSVVAPWITAHTIDVHLAALHMHARGKNGEISIHRQDGSEQCLLTIPQWDFNWQMGYELQKPAPIVRGDKLYLRCTWDNSDNDVDVNWGERTVDEMCIGFLYLIPEQ